MRSRVVRICMTVRPAAEGASKPGEGETCVGSHFAAAERGSLRSRAAQIRVALWLVLCPEVVEDPELLVVIRD